MTFQEDPEDPESEFLPVDITKCWVVVDTNWYDMVTCTHLVQPPASSSSGYGSASSYNGFYAYVVPGTLGENTCTRRQVWSKYRNKCIRSYKRY